MAEIKITDLVDQKTLDDLKELKVELETVRQTYIDVAKELAKGLNMKIATNGDVEKMTQIITEGAKKANEATQQLNATVEKQREIVGRTTNEISRELAAIEKENAAKREAVKTDKDALQIAESVIGTRQQNIERLVRLQQQLKEVSEEEKRLDKAIQNGQISEQGALRKRTELAERTRDYKAAIKDLNVVLNNQDKQMMSSEGSYQRLSLQLELMKKAYKGMTDEEKKSAEGMKLSDEIDNLDAHLKDLAASMGEFQRNVGNYAVANQSVRAEMRELIQEIAGLTIEYRNMSDEEKNSATGQEMAEKIQDLTSRASVLKDAIADVNREVVQGADDAQNFNAISEGVQTLVDGFGVATGAAHLLGLSEEDLLAIQTKLQSAYVVSNGLMKMQNALQKESAMMTGVARLQKAAATAAENLHTAAQGKNIVVTKAATVAQAALNAVAKANPYVLLASAVVTVVGALALFASGTKKETEEMKKEREEMERLKKEHEEYLDVKEKINEARGKALEKVSDEIVDIRLLQGAIEDVNAANEDRVKAINKLRELYPDILKNYTDEEIKAGAASKAIDGLVQSLINKAIVEEKIELIKEYARKYVKSLDDIRKATKDLSAAEEERDEANRKRSENAENYAKKRSNFSAGVTFYDAMTLGGMNSKDVQAAQDKIDTLTEKISELKKASEDYKESIIELQKEVKPEDLMTTLSGGSKGGSKASAKTEKEMKDIKSVILQYTMEIIAAKIELTEEGSKEEYNLTLQYIDAIIAVEKDKLSSKYEEEKKILDENLKNKKTSQDQYNNDLITLQEVYNEKYRILEEKMGANILQARSKYYEKQVEELEKRHQDEQDALQLQLVKETTALTKQRMECLITEEEYQEKLYQLKVQYAQETAKKEIEFLEEVLKAEGITSEKRAEIAKELAMAKEELALDTAIEAKKQGDKEVKDEKKATETKTKLVFDYLKAVADVMSSVGDLMAALHDAEIQKLEEKQEANDAAYEKEVEQIEQLAETGAISTEEAEARKTAAKQKSEEQNEEIDKQIAEIKYKQAIFDKVTAIAQAGINTALGITSALAMGPVGIPISVLIGAMGAIQVATIAATPISQYAKGTGKEGHGGGPAIVGDGGKQEAVVFDGKMWLTPDTPTLVDLPKGARVYPDAKRIPIATDNLVPFSENKPPVVILNNDSRKVEKGIEKTNRLLKQSIIMQRRMQYNAVYAAYKKAL